MEKIFKLRFLITCLIALCLSEAASALPVYADQTEQKCAACHISVGELTPAGRKFKLLGYSEGIRKSLFSGLATASLTKIKSTSSSLSPSDAMPRDGSAVAEGVSALITGKFTDDVGGKIKWTANLVNTTPIYGSQGVQTGTKVGRDFFLDASEIRTAKRATALDRELIYGMSINNAPGQQDLWITTPVNSFPYKTSSLLNAWGIGQFGPTTLMDGGLTSQTMGVSFFGLLDNKWFLDLGNYWRFSTNKGFIAVAGPENTINSNVNPYFRLARTQTEGEKSWMLGTFGMLTKLNNDPLVQGSSPGRYRDIGVDAEYQNITDTHTWSAQAVFIHELVNWDARAVGQSHDATTSHLNTLKAKISYNYLRKYNATWFGFKSTGTQDNLYWAYNPDPNVVTGACNQSNSLLAFCSQNGKPNTVGFGFELSYSPTPKVTVAIQQTFYKKFLGASQFIDNSSGNLRSASDNDFTYAYIMYSY
jgi:hypothetical protein